MSADYTLLGKAQAAALGEGPAMLSGGLSDMRGRSLQYAWAAAVACFVFGGAPAMAQAAFETPAGQKDSIAGTYGEFIELTEGIVFAGVTISEHPESGEGCFVMVSSPIKKDTHPHNRFDHSWSSIVSGGFRRGDRLRVNLVLPRYAMPGGLDAREREKLPESVACHYAFKISNGIFDFLPGESSVDRLCWEESFEATYQQYGLPKISSKILETDFDSAFEIREEQDVKYREDSAKEFCSLN